MKTIHVKIIFLLCVTLWVSCNDDFLDRKPQNIISDDAAYASLSGIEALTAVLYQKMPTEDFEFWFASQAGFPSQFTDEAVRSYTWGAANDPVLGDGWYGWWGYNNVRNVNDFIAKIPTASISEDLKTRFLAEARFIRAFYYFSMVKRYGGIPLITKVQDYTGDNLDSIQLPRNTEKEIYDFIAKELDEVAPLLPETNSSENQFRVTRYAALTLKSRAMLYAASAAEFGSYQLNGLIGIQASEADSYWQKTYDVSKEIIDKAKFSLYNSNPDKAANFQELFLKLAGNPEVIFAQTYLAPDKTHCFDYFNTPHSFCFYYGSCTSPTLELVEEFEYTNGSEGKLKIKNPDGSPILYSNPRDLFKDKDPRLLASILVPFADWQGGIVEVRRGIIDGGVKYTSDNLTQTYGTGVNSITRVGKDGPLTNNDPTKTGFYLKKYLDPVNKINYYKSTNPWYVFRYAEVLLNYAEAAFELGKTADALWAVNQIRTRAGIATILSISRDQIRRERKVEFAFENHRWWDIRRWKIADQLLSNTQFHALYPWLMWEEGKSPAQMKYTFEIVNAPKNTRTFPSKLYYELISSWEIVKNPKLIQNPGY